MANTSLPTKQSKSKICTISGCSKISTSRHKHCPMHQHRIRRHGDPHYTVQLVDRTMTGTGYVLVRHNGTLVLEHRLIMEQHIGRHLASDEVVHHINEIKTDNRVENLQVMTNSEHMEHHATIRKRILKGGVAVCSLCGVGRYYTAKMLLKRANPYTCMPCRKAHAERPGTYVPKVKNSPGI